MALAQYRRYVCFACDCADGVACANSVIFGCAMLVQGVVDRTTRAVRAFLGSITCCGDAIRLSAGQTETTLRDNADLRKLLMDNEAVLLFQEAQDQVSIIMHHPSDWTPDKVKTNLEKWFLYIPLKVGRCHVT